MIDVSQFRPLRDGILLRRMEYRGLLKLTDAEPSTTCEVLAVGPGKWLDGKHFQPTSVKPGQMVVIGPYVDLDQDDLVVCQEADIRVVVEASL